MFNLATKAVTTHGTRVRLSATPLRAYRCIIQARSSNTGSVYVGGATVANKADTAGAFVGHELLPGDSLAPLHADPYDLYIDADVSGEGVDFSYDV